MAARSRFLLVGSERHRPSPIARHPSGVIADGDIYRLLEYTACYQRLQWLRPMRLKRAIGMPLGGQVVIVDTSDPNVDWPNLQFLSATDVIPVVLPDTGNQSAEVGQSFNITATRRDRRNDAILLHRHRNTARTQLQHIDPPHYWHADHRRHVRRYLRGDRRRGRDGERRLRYRRRGRRGAAVSAFHGQSACRCR